MSKLRLNVPERDFSFHNEYIQRWFNNQVLLKHLINKTELLKEPKVMRFFQKISKMMQFNIDGLLLINFQRKEVGKEWTH